MTPKDDAFFAQQPGIDFVRFADKIADCKLVVYGAGGGFASFKSFVLDRYELAPDFVVDKKYEGQELGSMVGVDTFFAMPLTTIGSSAFILITIANQAILDSVILLFQQNGYYNVFSIFDIYEYNLIYADKDFENQARNIYRRDKDKIVKAFDLLCDEKSRHVYAGFLSAHLTKVSPYFGLSSYPVQYTPVDLPLRSSDIRLLNCGAFNGDTIENFVRSYGRLDLVCAFEPDPDNFEALRKNKAVLDQCKSVMLLPLGVGNDNHIHPFSSGNGMISKVENGSATGSHIQTIKVDDVFHGMHFNKVVIDTEGSEMPILLGMQNTIVQDLPDLCIACYHQPTDIYEILLLILRMSSKYKFYIRNHSSVCVDTVLYAISSAGSDIEVN